MKAVARLASLARLASQSTTASSIVAAQPQVAAWSALKIWKSGFSSAVDALENTTGAEREEIEAKLKGIENPWHEAWLDAPFGTEENPVVVPSEFSERIVGCADPDDDSLVWWAIIEEGQPPKQIIEGGEYFVLKRIAPSGGH